MHAVIVVAIGLSNGCAPAKHAKNGDKLNTFDVEEPVGGARSGPQIAYVHGVTYLLASDAMAPALERQVALCRAMGPSRCVVVESSVTIEHEVPAETGASAKLLIDARLSNSLMRRLDGVVMDTGGSVAARNTAAEDVSGQIIDTDARIRAKQALADRLVKLIASNNGKVGDLVAAEKAFAETQEQLDAARSQRALLRQRVSMSEIQITYRAAEATGIFGPVRVSLGDAGRTFGRSVAVLATTLVAMAPWVLLVIALAWIARRMGWRWRRKRRSSSEG